MAWSDKARQAAAEARRRHGGTRGGTTKYIGDFQKAQDLAATRRMAKTAYLERSLKGFKSSERFARKLLRKK